MCAACIQTSCRFARFASAASMVALTPKALLLPPRCIAVQRSSIMPLLLPCHTTRLRPVAVLAALCFASLLAHAAPVALQCNYRVTPLGIDTPHPSLSWQSDSAEKNWKQSAYRITVSSTEQLARSGKGDVWDSGRQSSSSSVDIAYGGTALQFRALCNHVSNLPISQPFILFVRITVPLNYSMLHGFTNGLKQNQGFLSLSLGRKGTSS